MINFIPCKVDIKSNPFCDTTILSYEIELPFYGNKIGFSLLDAEIFTTPSVIDTIPKTPAIHKLTTQYIKYIFIIAIN